MKKNIRRTPASIRRGSTRRETILAASPEPLGRRELHLALEPIVQGWIAAVSRWNEPTIGDYRYLVLSCRPEPEVEVYVQFWSEPLEPVLWEVSSGRPNPPTDEWLAGERAGRIEALGFTIGGKADNYRREVGIETPADVAVIAKAVVTIFYQAFDYRGLVPIEATLGWDGRGEIKETFDAFTPEDLMKIFAALGFATEARRAVEGEPPGDAADSPMVIRCRKRRMTTIVQPADRVEGQNLYRQIRLVFEAPGPAARGRSAGSAGARVPDAADVRFDTVLPFGGGVTIDWLAARISDWEAVLAHLRRPGRRAALQALPAQETIH